MNAARAPAYPGWEALFKIIVKDLGHKSDLLIVLLHYFLVNQNNYLCLGVGENKKIEPDDTGSELLPDGWNADENRYTLRYIFDNKLYTVLATRSEGTLIINFLEVHTICVSTMAMHIDSTVHKMGGGNLTEMIPTAGDVFDRMRKELLAPMSVQVSSHVGTQTEEKCTRSVYPNVPSRPDRDAENLRSLYNVDPQNVGRADLLPFGRGGGMLMPDPGRVPLQFNIPPVGRYDPIFPDDLSVEGGRPRRRGPNPDHMRPPTFDYL